MSNHDTEEWFLFYETDTGRHLVSHATTFLQFVRTQLIHGHLEKGACHCHLRTPAYTLSFTTHPTDPARCQLVVQDTDSTEERLHMQQTTRDHVVVNHEFRLTTTPPYSTVLNQLARGLQEVQTARGMEVETNRSTANERMLGAYTYPILYAKKLLKDNRKTFSKTCFSTIIHTVKALEHTVRELNASSSLSLVEQEVDDTIGKLEDATSFVRNHLASGNKSTQAHQEDKLVIAFHTVFISLLDVQERLAEKKR